MYQKSLLILFIFLSYNCIGQGGISSLSFDHLTIKDGLSHNTISGLLQDQYGYIWIGTQYEFGL